VLRLRLMLRSRRPDVFIAPHASSGPLPPLFARLVGAPVSIGPQGSWWRLGFSQAVQRLPLQHKVEYYADFARRAGLYTQFDARFEISSDAERVEAARDLLAVGSNSAKRWIVLAPGSSPIELHKRWPLTHYRELIQRLTSDDSALQIALLGSPSEMPLLEDLAAALSPRRALVIAQPDVEFTLELIRHAAVLICGCTGAGHMAALVGTPIVGIYGPTNPSFTGPFTPWLRLVRRGYACSPCYRRGFEHGCGNPICMTDIAVDQVFDAVRATLRGEPFPEAPQLSTTNATHPPRQARRYEC
jgi:lipopolysaccharide heptosyltransferase II